MSDSTDPEFNVANLQVCIDVSIERTTFDGKSDAGHRAGFSHHLYLSLFAELQSSLLPQNPG